MGLPLPNVLYDVGPGGGIVTSMGGGNALANNMHLKKINQVKAQYAPLTTQAEAASKLAYANLMAPQFLAKAMHDPAFMANLSEGQKNMIKDLVYSAGTGQGTGANFLNQLPAQQQQPSNNSFLEWAKNLFKGHIDQGAAKKNSLLQNTTSMPQSMPNPETQMPQPGSPGLPINENDPRMFAVLDKWRQSPEGQKKIAETGNPEVYPEAQELRNWAEKQQGRAPVEMTLREGQRAKTWAEKTGEQQGIVKEGEKTGEIRAKDREELDNQYQQALQSEVPLKHLNKIVSNPVFQNMRKFPWFQKLQLNAKSKIGSYEEQKLVGDFQATALRAVAETVMGFRGRILDKEVTLANDMKVSPNDTIPVIIGKLPSIEAFNEMTKKRSRIANRIMRDYHVSKGDALEEADKQVDGEAIRAKVERELEGYPNREDIEFTAKEMNITPEEVIKRLKARGKYHA